LISASYALDNGLALTPPMGWLAWERFRCVIDCDQFPDSCINEDLFLSMADRMVTDGFKDAGYIYVNIDDCYLAKTRDKNGFLIPDPVRFPHGLNWLSDQIHNRGLKLGVYEDYGVFTCGGYPGIYSHEATDTKTFANWMADSVKLDGCYMKSSSMESGYSFVSKLLNQTGRPMLFSCSGPDYQRMDGLPINYTLYGNICNLWRLFDDIQDSWESVLNIINYWGDNQNTLIKAAGPGHWNDPDMLIIGDFGLSFEQSKAQMAFWAIFAAPLYMSNDLRRLTPWQKEILLNKEIININQDKLGKQGRRVNKSNGVEVWMRNLSRGRAVLLFNPQPYGTPYLVTANWSDLGLNNSTACQLRDLFAHSNIGTFTQSYSSWVNPTGVQLLYFNC